VTGKRLDPHSSACNDKGHQSISNQPPTQQATRSKNQSEATQTRAKLKPPVAKLANNHAPTTSIVANIPQQARPAKFRESSTTKTMAQVDESEFHDLEAKTGEYNFLENEPVDVLVGHAANKTFWKPGSVISCHGNGPRRTYTVQWTDGSTSHAISPGLVRVRDLNAARVVTGDELLPVGTKVQSRYLGKHKWFSGQVAKVGIDDRGSARYEIKFDDGEVEEAVSAVFVRRLDGGIHPIPPPTNSNNAAIANGFHDNSNYNYIDDNHHDWSVVNAPGSDGATTFSEGQRVYALLSQQHQHQHQHQQYDFDQWKPGTIRRVNFNGTFDVLLDNGRFEPAAQPHQLRPMDDGFNSPMDSPSFASAIASSSTSGKHNTHDHHQYHREQKQQQQQQQQQYHDAASQLSPTAVFSVGQPVKAKYGRTILWSNGQIARANSTGTYDILFGDGVLQRMVPALSIAPVDESGAMGAQRIGYSTSSSSATSGGGDGIGGNPYCIGRQVMVQRLWSDINAPATVTLRQDDGLYQVEVSSYDSGANNEWTSSNELLAGST